MIKSCDDQCSQDWLELRMALWPEYEASVLLAEMKAQFSEPDRFCQFIFYDGQQEAVGLVEASIRTDSVNGSHSSPTGFLEGIYVSPSFRRKGIAGLLVEEVKSWVVQKGCKELASDVLFGNNASSSMHLSLGFTETERVIFYRMDIKTNSVNSAK